MKKQKTTKKEDKKIYSQSEMQLIVQGVTQCLLRDLEPSLTLICKTSFLETLRDIMRENNRNLQ